MSSNFNYISYVTLLKELLESNTRPISELDLFPQLC